jgi:hypothetical protein
MCVMYMYVCMYVCVCMYLYLPEKFLAYCFLVPRFQGAHVLLLATVYTCMYVCVYVCIYVCMHV